MNTLFDEELRGHHRLRDQLLAAVSDADLDYRLPGRNPSLGQLLVEMGEVQGVYTHAFETFTLDWTHRRIPPPDHLTIVGRQPWFDANDAALDTAMSRSTDEVLRSDRVDRGGGFIASPFVQYEIFREAIYIFYGKLSVYLKALGIDAGEEWATGIG